MTPGIQVLHVDDDDAFRKVSTQFLEQEGFEVVTVDSAHAALQELSGDHAIDCVVSDYDMPDFNGLEFLDEVRANDPVLPFILFTGKGSEEIASEAISVGVTDYLQKDPTGDQFTLLANRIRRAVTERETEAALKESERMLSTLVSNLPGIVYRCQNLPDWPLEYIGGNVAEITGYTPRAFLAGDQTWAGLIHEDDQESVWNAVQTAITTRDPFEITYRITNDEGEVRWLREQGRGVFESHDDDKPVALEGFITDITDRRRRERELAEYDRLVDAMGDPVYTTDAEGCITTFNDRAAEITGYDADDVLGEPVSIMLDHSEIERGQAVIRELLQNDDESTVSYNLTINTAHGDRLELENHVALLEYDGEFAGTIGVLRSSERHPDSRLRRLHDATRELMGETDPDSIAALTTDAARDILDIPIASVRFPEGENLEVVAITEESTNISTDVAVCPIDGSIAGNVFRTGEPRVEPVVSRRDRIHVPGNVESAAYFPLGDHGVFITAATEPDAFDESDIQLATILAANAEAALDRAAKETALRDGRDDLAALFENIPDPTVETVIQDDGPIVERVNPAFESVFGYTNEEVRGENLDEYVVPDSQKNEAVAYNQRTEEGARFRDEVRRRTADGIRDFILHVVPHSVSDDETRSYVIYTDITEQKQRERELERQNERLDQFASVVSHDLRNPLSVARGRLDLARMTGEASHFDAIERAHDRMDELINGLLALARRGELTDDPVSVDLEHVASTAWETVDTQDLQLEFDDSAAIIADPERVRQLFENLFRNTNAHGETASTVTVGMCETPGFYVEDDGRGIPEEVQNDILDEGFAASDMTGLGLAIVDSIAEAHGWTLEIQDGAAGGARFEFQNVSTAQ